MENYRDCLIIDDDLDDQEIFIMCVNKIGASIKCSTANNGVEAITLLESNPGYTPAFIFLDMNMPKMNGFECLKQLKKSELYKHIPVVILSTSNRREDIERCRELGAASYFTKPTSFAELFNKLQNILKNGILR